MAQFWHIELSWEYSPRYRVSWPPRRYCILTPSKYRSVERITKTVPPHLFPYSLYPLGQEIHQLLLGQVRVGPLPAAAREGVTEGLLAAEGSKVLAVCITLQWGEWAGTWQGGTRPSGLGRTDRGGGRRGWGPGSSRHKLAMRPFWNWSWKMRIIVISGRVSVPDHTNQCRGSSHTYRIIPIINPLQSLYSPTQHIKLQELFRHHQQDNLLSPAGEKVRGGR